MDMFGTGDVSQQQGGRRARTRKARTGTYPALCSQEGLQQSPLNHTEHGLQRAPLSFFLLHTHTPKYTQLTTKKERLTYNLHRVCVCVCV